MSVGDSRNESFEECQLADDIPDELLPLVAMDFDTGWYSFRRLFQIE
jgi:hypothetical protein